MGLVSGVASSRVQTALLRAAFLLGSGRSAPLGVATALHTPGSRPVVRPPLSPPQPQWTISAWLVSSDWATYTFPNQSLWLERRKVSDWPGLNHGAGGGLNVV